MDLAGDDVSRERGDSGVESGMEAGERRPVLLKSSGLVLRFCGSSVKNKINLVFVVKF